jgi:uncharacterized protein YqjF (DUF2071 family)
MYDIHMRKDALETGRTTGAPGNPVASPICPLVVAKPQMIHRWDELTFLHWRYDPAVIQALLPDGLTAETFDGGAWVGLVPFAMQVTWPGRGPTPWLSRFCETNVRTYASAADGTTGVYFLSLDAARLPAVTIARSVYRLPYFWSDMEMAHVGSVMSYRSRRRWPGPRGARCDVTVAVGEQFADDELGDLDHWLTARWRLYIDTPQGMQRIDAQHRSWPLWRADVVHLDEDLTRAAGLPAPDGPPLVHWSPGVEVRIGARHLVERRAAGLPA